MGISKEESFDLINHIVLVLFQFRYPVSKLTKTNEIGSKYAADNNTSSRKLSLPPHVVLARKLTALGDVRQAGERIDIMFLCNDNPKAELCDRIGEPNNWRSNGCMPRIDFCLYVEKQLLNPLSQIFNIYFKVEEKEDTFGKYIRTLNKYHEIYKNTRKQLMQVFENFVLDSSNSVDNEFIQTMSYKKFNFKIICTEKPNYIPTEYWNQTRCKRYSFLRPLPKTARIDTFFKKKN